MAAPPLHASAGGWNNSPRSFSGLVSIRPRAQSVLRGASRVRFAGIHPTPDEPDFDQPEQLYIDPEECTDCDACVETCPVDAITPEDMVPSEWQNYIEINAAYFREKAA